MNVNKVIVRLRGGLGNQLFGYATARRLALVNQAELVIDDKTGFVRDRKYFRRYALDNFSIPARKATSWERMEPIERLRRGLVKYANRQKPFERRNYLEQEKTDFDPRLLLFHIRGTVTLDGYWQSEKYFIDAAETIRHDLQINHSIDPANQRMAERMFSRNAVAIHVRWFGDPRSNRGTLKNNLEQDYYIKAIQKINGGVSEPHFFLFSDNMNLARTMLDLPEESITYVDHNQNEDAAHMDLWLMSCCKHFIIANSTYSWWGAWLGESESSIVIAPALRMTGICAWGFSGLLPERWLTC